MTAKAYYESAVLQQARVSFVNWWISKFRCRATYGMTFQQLDRPIKWSRQAYHFFLRGERSMPLDVWEAWAANKWTGPRRDVWTADVIKEGTALHALTINAMYDPRRTSHKARRAAIIDPPLAALARIDALCNEIEPTAPLTADALHAEVEKIRQYITGRAS